MTKTAAALGSAVPPRIVVLREGRAGDDRQLINLAEALGRPYEVVPFQVPVGRVLRDRVMDALRLHGAPAGREHWGPPWPDLVLASGGRAVSAAVRLRRLSGGRTKIVFVGRPWARLDHFDLVITTPQYRLPDAANVVQNTLPLNTIPDDRLHEAGAQWAEKVAHLPAPYITVLLGGDSSSHRLDAGTAERLARRASARAAALGGSVLATSSPRTPREAMDAFVAALDAPSAIYRWQPDDTENPLTGYLALASRLIVTGESASMLAEACRTGKTVDVVPLPKRRRARLRTAPLGGRANRLARLFAPLGRRLARMGLWVPPRDMAHLHAALRDAAAIGSDGALRLGKDADLDLPRAAARIEALLAVQGQTAYKAASRYSADIPARPASNEQNG